MPGKAWVEMRVVLRNQDAVDAFGEAMELLEELLEDSPWLSGVSEAVDKLRYAAERITLEEVT